MQSCWCDSYIVLCRSLFVEKVTVSRKFVAMEVDKGCLSAELARLAAPIVFSDSECAVPMSAVLLLRTSLPDMRQTSHRFSLGSRHCNSVRLVQTGLPVGGKK